MRLIINVSNLRFGGGKTVGINFIQYYLNNTKIKKILIFAPKGCGYEIFNNVQEKLTIFFLPEIFNRSIFKIVSNYIILPFITLMSRFDFVLSLGNVAYPSIVPQFVLIHQAFIAYPESTVWEKVKNRDEKFYYRLRQMVSFIKFNLRYAKYIGVQTLTMKKRISEQYSIPFHDIFVVPNAISFTSMQFEEQKGSPYSSSKIKLLFLSKYFPHKNYEILYVVSKLIKEKNLPIQFSVTLDENENEGTRKFLSEIEALGLNNIVKNVGNISLDKISDIYLAHDGLFLPTLLESYSGTYIEAMYFEKPIFTSNLDFALESCKDAGFYFDPFNAEEIVKVIINAFQNPEIINERIKIGKQYVTSSNSWKDIGEFLDANILMI